MRRTRERQGSEGGRETAGQAGVVVLATTCDLFDDIRVRVPSNNDNFLTGVERSKRQRSWRDIGGRSAP